MRQHLLLLVFAGLGAAAMPSASVHASGFTAPSSSTYDLVPGGFTVECWVRARTLPGENPIVIRVGPPTRPSETLWLLGICKNAATPCSPGLLHFAVKNSGADVALFTSTASVDDDRWHHVAVTYDGTTFRMYLDGALNSSLTQPGVSAAVGSGVVTLGVNVDGANQLDGRVDDVRIWNVARTQSEIADNRGTEIAVQAQLAAYWQLNCDGTELVAGNTMAAQGTASFQRGTLSSAGDIGTAGPDVCGSKLPGTGTITMLALVLGLLATGVGVTLTRGRSATPLG